MAKTITMQLKQLSHLSIQAGVCLLLFLYLATFLFPQGSAPHVHTGHDLHEEDACKKDACHIAIYHPGSEAGCQHKFHFTKAPEECLLCHSIATRHIPVQIIVTDDLVSARPSFTPTAIIGKDFTVPIDHDDRGPPFKSFI